MKLTENQKFTLKLLVGNPEITNTEIAARLKITSQAVGKIRKNLTSSGLIKNCEIVLDYEKIGVTCFAIGLIKIMPRAFKKFKLKELDKLLQPVNVIHSFTIPQTDVTHVMIYAFRNIEEYDNYFKTLQTELGEFIEIKETYVFSTKSLLKSSSKGLFLKIIEEYGEEKMPIPEVSKLEEV